MRTLVARALSLRERVAKGRVRAHKHALIRPFGHLLPEGEGLALNISVTSQC